MQENNKHHQTHTSDSANGVQTFVIRAWLGFVRSEIVLRHPTMECWCGAGGDWVEERMRAVRFITNLDALVYCQALGLSGVIVAFDGTGRQIYELSVDRVLDAISTDTRVQSLLGRNSEDGNYSVDAPEGAWPLLSRLPPL